MTLWYAWLRVCPYGLRDYLVPGWRELRQFVEAWMATPGSVARKAAYVPDRVPACDWVTKQTIMVPLPADPIDEEEFARSQISTRQDVAFRFLGGKGVDAMRLRIALQRIGSFSAAMALVHRNRRLMDSERNAFASHACPPEEVTWQHVASGTVALLAALFMIPPGVEE